MTDARPRRSPPKRPQSAQELAPEPPPKRGDELAEVERALSVLGGHHPEHERAKREVNEALSRKRTADEVASSQRMRDGLKRTVAIATGAVLVALAGYAVWQRHAHRAAVERSLDPPSASFAPRGFSPVASSENGIEEQTEAGCYIAVTPLEGDGKLEVEHGGETLTGERSIGWCACTPEKVAVRSAAPVRLLRAEGRAIGNIDGLAAVEPHPRVMSTRVEDCAAAELDGWLAEKEIARTPVDAAAFAADRALAPLAAAGFAPVAALPAGRSFAVVNGEAASCFLAWSRVPEDALTMRMVGGERPIATVSGTIGWCSEKAKLVTVWRHGEGEAVVAAAPAARVAGMLGLRERAARAKLGAVTAWIAPEEVAWDALETLRGNGASEPSVVLSGNDVESKANGDARIVAISLAHGGSYAPDRRGTIAFACSPKTDADVLQTVCAQAGAQTWRQTGALGALGLAQAPLPFWLSVFASVKDPELPKPLVALLGLARRLKGDGFEPTTLAGVVEESNGVSVVGRAGDDAIVAVGLAPRPPYVWTYSDGEDWDIQREPRVIELKPGERALLASATAPAVPKEQRRTVVFRRPSAATAGGSDASTPTARVP